MWSSSALQISYPIIYFKTFPHLSGPNLPGKTVFLKEKVGFLKVVLNLCLFFFSNVLLFIMGDCCSGALDKESYN